MTEEKIEDGKNNPGRKKKFRHHKQKFMPCKHDYAYCYYSHKNRESVYQCVNCGKWLYV